MKNKKFLILIFFVCVFNYNATAQVSGLPPKTEDRNVDCGIKTKVDFTKSELKGPSLSVERDVSQNNINVAVKASVGLLGGTTTIGQEISDDGLSKLVIGQTKYQEVIENFGKPTVVERTNEIFMAVYQFKKIESERDIKSFIPIVGFFVAKPSTQDSVSRSVNFMFEPESGVLVSCTKTDTKDEQLKSPGFFDALKGVKIN